VNSLGIVLDFKPSRILYHDSVRLYHKEQFNISTTFESYRDMYSDAGSQVTILGIHIENSHWKCHCYY
jgi:hypothetical protein